jgi:hypothetical protein
MNKTLVSGLFLLFSVCAFGQGKDYTAGKIAEYRAHAIILPRFVPLEVGEIRPEG